MATKPTPQQEASSLYVAADLITAKGLIRGTFQTCKGRCTVGAIAEAVTGWAVPPEDLSSVPLLESLLSLVSEAVVSNVVDDHTIERIADWSDAPDRTAGEVVQLLRRLADGLLAEAAVDAAHELDAQLAEQRHQLLDPAVMDYTVRTSVADVAVAA